jgi:hypothetical protein
MLPTTLAWANVSAERRVVTVKGAVLFTALYVAVRVTVTFAVTGVVVTANVAVVAPWATVTFAGTEAAALFLERVTTAPPEGAATSSVTVPVAAPTPPTTLAGLTEREVRFAPNAAGDASRREPRTHALRRISNLPNLFARGGAITYKSC